jgi:hypothetical protein
MSYSRRKANLECAIWLLDILNRDNTIEQSIAASTFRRALCKMKTFRELSAMAKAAGDRFTIYDIERSTRVLYLNDHVCYRYNHDDFMNSEVSCTVAGKDAYIDGFYPQAIARDFDETMTLRFRWILPYLTVLFSVAALAISILSYYHHH